jgi:hypothetical protein
MTNLLGGQKSGAATVILNEVKNLSHAAPLFVSSQLAASFRAKRGNSIPLLK